MYSVLLADNTSSTPTSTDTTTPDSKSNIVPLAVGLTFGLLTLVMIALGAFYLQRRRRALLDTRATAPHHTPLAQGDHLSGVPHESKHHPQPIKPPTHGSTLSPGAPTSTAVPATSSGIPESGILPSHEPYEHGESGPLEKMSPLNT